MVKVREGKTKIIWTGPKPHQVQIESKDDITAGDGEKRDIIAGKAKLATETTCNCFLLLENKGIRTHFLRRGNERVFVAQEMKMIPIEIVSRRYAVGSYLKRNPNVPKGKLFSSLVVELFFKDDKLHDPIMLWDEKEKTFRLYDPHSPTTSKSYIRSLSPGEITTPSGRAFSQEEVQKLYDLGRNVFFILERAWKSLDHTLIDLKIECGWDPRGDLAVGDVIDNDSWRLRKGLKNGQVLDKQAYRDIKKSDPESLEMIRQNYAIVADLTGEFPYL
ncbi:MAG: phosphoribosylaminoimidazolesuccinocarboxamide synthase [Parcubacteria group bacterium]|nr:MAG: phosphoribosylaminoimidazolesuccinocarboxamide synthase [Parcubacteria group bacterium]